MGRHLSLDVVGADHLNRRGPTRRFEIALCNPGEPVELRTEPKNPADPLAIAVYSCRGIQIGYISAERAQFIGGALRRGMVKAVFQQVTRRGAAIRASLDGSQPTLPTQMKASETDQHVSAQPADTWFPDELPADE